MSNQSFSDISQVPWNVWKGNTVRMTTSAHNELRHLEAFEILAMFAKKKIEFVAKYILTTGSLQPRTSVDFASRESHSISVVGRVVARCYNIQHHPAFNNAMYCLKINMKIIFSLIIPCPFSWHNEVLVYKSSKKVRTKKQQPSYYV